ncbi:MAG TPA: hypothetical protein VF442_03835, partial [Sphingobium sp.]
DRNWSGMPRQGQNQGDRGSWRGQGQGDRGSWRGRSRDDGANAAPANPPAVQGQPGTSGRMRDWAPRSRSDGDGRSRGDGRRSWPR